MTRFIFTVTAGRTGTAYLAELFKANYPEAETYHEILGYDYFGVHTPELSHLLQFNSRGNTDAVQAFWDQKLRRIAKSTVPIYLESSHLLAKAGLIENIEHLTSVGEVHVLLLQRDFLKMVTSYMDRGDFRNIGNMWMWYLDPNYPRNILSAEPFQAGGRENLCIWYAFEMAVRQEYYRQILSSVKGVHVHDAFMGEITQEAGARSLFGAIGLDLPGSVTIPPPKNARLATASLSPAQTLEIQNSIESWNLDAASLAKQFIGSGDRLE